jgi:isopentenyl diphosphate isomerase/L-lactate dehydrogenase-like FMN-dependent dehydrogenase
VRGLERQTSIFAAGVELRVRGEAGVREVVTNFLADFDLTMGLAGCRSVGEISEEAPVRAPAN